MDISSDSASCIIDRLEKLKLWQEGQRKVLQNKQNAQREMLGMEHKKMYELFGLSQPTSTTERKELVNSKKECSGDSDIANVPKKTFLRRGQGCLATRYKVNCDDFRLHNVPKYKFANAHKGRFDNVRPGAKKNLKKPQTARLSLDKSEEQDHAPITAQKEKPSVPVSVAKQQVNIEDIPIQELLRKSSKNSIENVMPEQNDNIENISINLELKKSTKTSIQSNSLQFELSTPLPAVSWATVLNPEQPKPIQFQRFDSEMTMDNSQNESDNLSIFEMIEKKAAAGSFNMNNSFIQRWITEKARNIVDKMEDTPIAIDEAIKELHPPPNQFVGMFDSDSYVTIEEEEVDGEASESETEHPHVRFSEHVEINELGSETENESSYELLNHSRTSTPNEKARQLYADSSTPSVEDTTLMEQGKNSTATNEMKRDLTEKTEFLKVRLAELENELEMFKRNNLELMKLKQQHELEKAALEQERSELFDQINDEKLKMEIYLHDERMKIEDDRKKLDKMIKDQKVPNRKEREEITKLKEEVDSLQKELKNRDSKHVAAQSRLRAQIRNYEKDSKELNIEIDDLRKQVKKIEAENLRLGRESNNKMLNEINRNIAKLTPKENLEPIQATEVKNKNFRTVVAKVVSHQKQKSAGPPINRRSRSIRKDTTSASSESEDEPTRKSSTSESSVSDQELGTSSYFSKKKRSKSKSRRSKSMDKSKSEPNNSRTSLEENSFKREICNSDGSKDIWYPNGNLKKISPDGMTIRMLYFNKDIKETNINEGTIKYYYSETNTWHTTYLDGLEILEFPNGQTEHRYKDGTVEVHFPNGSIRVSNANDDTKAEEWRYPDGTLLVQMKNGDKVLSLPNGQKEIHTKLHRRREYPDGTVKLVYPDGSQETRYSNGRVRLKDKDGNLVMDSINNNY